MHRLDLSLYSHPKEIWRNGVRTHVNSKERIPSEVTGMAQPGNRSTAKAGIELRSATDEAHALPLGQRGGLVCRISPHNSAVYRRQGVCSFDMFSVEAKTMAVSR